MNTQRLIQKLEGVVRERTPQYVSLSNPQYDKKLMKAHYLLARIYGKEGNTKQAHSHFREAEHEFLNMCRIEIQQPEYFTSGKEGFQRFREQKRIIKRRLEYCQHKLFEIADKIGYDTIGLLWAQTSDNQKSNLAEIIKEYAV